MGLTVEVFPSKKHKAVPRLIVEVVSSSAESILLRVAARIWRYQAVGSRIQTKDCATDAEVGAA